MYRVLNNIISFSNIGINTVNKLKVMTLCAILGLMYARQALYH